MVNIAIFASGNGSNFENLVNAMKNGKITSATCRILIVDKENAYAMQRAKKLEIPYYYVNPKAFASKEEYEMCIHEKLKEHGVSLIVLAGYMRFIGSVLLANYGNGIINLHPAYLPNFPGAHSIRDAFEAKASFSGVTIHYVDAGVDTGDIIHQEKIEIDPEWSLDTLEEHVHALEYEMFPRVVQEICELMKREVTI